MKARASAPGDSFRAGLLLAFLPLVIALVGLDAARRRHASHAGDAAAIAVVARLPSADLALSGGARWLRFPALEDPAAAFQDAPAMPDPDPAGGMIAPPVSIWTNTVSAK